MPAVQLLQEFWDLKNTKYEKDLFYGKYSLLNNFYGNEYSSQELYNLQRTCLIDAYKDKPAVKKINDFIKRTMNGKEGTDDDSFGKLVRGINEGLQGFSMDSEEGKQQYLDYINNLDTIINEIKQLPGNRQIPFPDIKKLTKIASKNDFSQSEYVTAKGAYLEEVGQWIVQQAGLLGFETGSWYSKDSFFNEKSEKQMIEDIIGILREDIDKKLDLTDEGRMIKVKIRNYDDLDTEQRAKARNALRSGVKEWMEKTKKMLVIKSKKGKGGNYIQDTEYVKIGLDEKSFSKIGDFINALDMSNSITNGEFEVSIFLSDEFHKKLHDLGVNIQSKSNIERHLFNYDTERSKFSIPNNQKYYSLLLKLNNSQALQYDEWKTKKDEPYQGFLMYTNYQLAKNLHNTVLGRNEFYLTSEGFADLPTLMANRGFYFRIQNISLSYNQFLENRFEIVDAKK